MLDLGLKKREYSGLQFYDLTYDVPLKADITLTVNTRDKYVLRDANLSVDRHQGSYLYPEEAVISGWSTDAPKLEQRAYNNTEFRCEINTPLISFVQFCASAQSRIYNYLNNKRTYNKVVYADKAKVASFL